MKAKTRRLYFVLTGVLMTAGALAGLLFVFEDNLVFFYSPTEVRQKHEQLVSKKRLRIGGLIALDSVVDEGNNSLKFDLTDEVNIISVRYKGLKPPMFREGQGMVAEGVLKEGAFFEADKLMTKHDEKYMPPEVARTLKSKDHWRDKMQQGDGQYEGTSQ